MKQLYHEFYIGDEVYVKPRITKYKGLDVHPIMNKYFGTRQTISEYYTFKDRVCYRLAGVQDAIYWVWDETWLELANKIELSEDNILEVLNE